MHCLFRKKTSWVVNGCISNASKMVGRFYIRIMYLFYFVSRITCGSDEKSVNMDFRNLRTLSKMSLVWSFHRYLAGALT